MKNADVNITIDKTLNNIEVNARWLKSLLSNILEYIPAPKPIEMGIRLTDNANIRELNQQYRSIDEPTDVLSFNMLEHAHTDTEIQFISAPDNLDHIGEVIISYEKAIEQAGIYNNTIKKELAILLIHGILHLFGYDHESDKDYKNMHEKEEFILRGIEDRINLE
ncbi:MAG TPA: rRNA maturation RNase YbeY [Dehalococcoidia bacterium]|nr:rRNA maturation RNase YbeY [Dehalococcoidia bacterium]